MTLEDIREQLDKLNIRGEDRLKKYQQLYAGLRKGKRQTWVAEGKCIWCGKDKEQDDSLCAHCKKVHDKSFKKRLKSGELGRKVAERQAEHKEQGLCLDCNSPRVEGKLRCQACLDRIKQSAAEIRAEYKKQGLCGCGKPTDVGYATCHRCRSYTKGY